MKGFRNNGNKDIEIKEVENKILVDVENREFELLQKEVL